MEVRTLLTYVQYVETRCKSLGVIDVLLRVSSMDIKHQVNQSGCVIVAWQLYGSYMSGLPSNSLTFNAAHYDMVCVAIGLLCQSLMASGQSWSSLSSARGVETDQLLCDVCGLSERKASDL